MLVISRRKGELIRIGDDVEIIVLAVSRSVVRLAIRAPATVPVIRGKVDAQAGAVRKCPTSDER